MQKISPFLWFNSQAEEAVAFYTSIFKNSKITEITRYGAEGPGPQGSVMTILFQLEGQEIIALNGGPVFSFTPAVSLLVHCKTQKEVDKYWEKLTEGGDEGQCGWLTDKYGLSWQIVPEVLPELMADKDPEKARRVTQALMKMKKIDIEELQRVRESEQILSVA